MVVNPVTIGPSATLGDARALMVQHRISGIPVVMQGGPTRAGSSASSPIATVRFATVRPPADPRADDEGQSHHGRRDGGAGRGKRLLHSTGSRSRRRRRRGALHRPDHREGHREVAAQPQRLEGRAGAAFAAAATSVGDDGFERAERLIDAGIDLIVVDTAHGHSQRVLDAVARVKRMSNEVQVIAATWRRPGGAKALIDAGADAIKVGIGPGSICTTRIVAGVGVPAAVRHHGACEEADRSGVPVIADGGIKYSGDLAKALAAGASSAMIGSLLAARTRAPARSICTRAAPTNPIAEWARSARWRAARPTATSRAEVRDTLEARAGGHRGQVPYKGQVSAVLHQLAGGLRAAMGYVGAADLEAFRDKATFVRISNAGLRESHAHDVTITRESRTIRARACEAIGMTGNLAILWPMIVQAFLTLGILRRPRHAPEGSRRGHGRARRVALDGPGARAEQRRGEEHREPVRAAGPVLCRLSRPSPRQRRDLAGGDPRLDLRPFPHRPCRHPSRRQPHPPAHAGLARRLCRGRSSCSG